MPTIETALYESILALRQPLELRETFWASSLGMCPRKQVAERLGLPPTNPADRRSQMKMWTGVVVGAGIQARLLAQGYLHNDWHEKRVTYRSYSGRVDGFTDQIPGGAIVEIKTTDDSAITKYKDMPEHYLTQGMFYCVAAGIPNLLLLQFGKNQGLIRHRGYPITDQWVKRINAHIDFAEHCWGEYQVTQKLPDHVHAFGWENKWCPYLDVNPVDTYTDQEVSGNGY